MAEACFRMCPECPSKGSAGNSPIRGLEVDHRSTYNYYPEGQHRNDAAERVVAGKHIPTGRVGRVVEKVVSAKRILFGKDAVSIRFIGSLHSKQFITGATNVPRIEQALKDNRFTCDGPINLGEGPGVQDATNELDWDKRQYLCGLGQALSKLGGFDSRVHAVTNGANIWDADQQTFVTLLEDQVRRRIDNA